MGDSIFDKERKRRNKEINRRLAMGISQRLYLVDTKTGEKLILAEGALDEDGWLLWVSEYDINAWLKDRDLDAAHGTEPTTLVLKTEGVNE